MKLPSAAAFAFRVAPVLCLLAAISAARAGTLVNHPSTLSSTQGYTVWASEILPDGTVSARTYDNFQPGVDASIGEVDWQGVYVLQPGPDGNPASPNTTAFEIALWTDDGGQPGDMIVSATIPLADANPKSQGTVSFAFSATAKGPVPLFSYTATLPTPFAVAAGQTYWLSIASDSTSQQPSWGWVSGSGGDNSSVQDFNMQRLTRANDRAFKLKTAAAQILTDVNGRAFAARASLPLSASFAPPAAGDQIVEVDFLADGQIFAALDGNGNPLPSAAERPPIRKAAGSAESALVFQTTFTMPGADQLVNIVARALTALGKTSTSPAVAVQAVASTTDRPPAVSVNAPASAPIGVPITIPVTATDPDTGGSSVAPGRPRPRDFSVPSGVIARMEYYLNALEVKDSAEAPFGFSFTPTVPGTYVLTAIATDGSGLATASAPVPLQAFTPPTVTVAVKGADSVPENGGKGKFLFARDGTDLSSDLTVLYTLTGTAVNGVDYQELPGSVVIPAGAASVKVKFKTIDDAGATGTRKVKLKLAASANGSYVIGAEKKATISILDND